VLAAAEAILKSAATPRRTIRFVLFTGEEQGLLGSWAYVRDHAAELKNVIAAVALDWGQGPITALPLAGHSELTAPFEEFAEVVSGLGPLEINAGYLTFTDAYAFTLAAVAGICATPGLSRVYAARALCCRHLGQSRR
jgi:Zn-dependent M28 family amino/carboxypeptidase